MQAAFSTPKVSVAPRTVRCAALPSVARRQTFGLFAAGVLALVAPSAQAIEIPSQNSTGSTGGKSGSLPANGSEASQSGYNLQGTKKMGVSLKNRKKIIAEMKEKANADSLL